MIKPVILKNSVVELTSVGIFGFLAGGVSCLFLADHLAATPEYATLLSGFGGAILGSVISAWVAFVLAKQTAADAHEREVGASVATQKSYVVRLMVKASLVLSDVNAIKRSIEESLSEANELGLTDQPLWKRVLPMVGRSQTFDIDPAELSPIMAAKDNELMQSTVTLFLQHRNLVEAVRMYSELRVSVKQILRSHHLASHDGVITTALTQEQAAELLPYEVELDSLLKNIRENLPTLIKMAEQVTFGIGPAMRKFLGDDGIPSFAPKTPG
ncbi:hypothetical protein [Mesorhizobium sp.]|jgi:hypothetical protein|uniref:hypothetical protein n=1 Tax=Mesorhizobium sp. TaxID=1871066 RepID=UPI003562A4BF